MKRVLIIASCLLLSVYTIGFGEQKTVTHTYSGAGNYTTSVLVSDGFGGVTRSNTIVIQVRGNLPPNVVMTAVPTSGLAPLTVQFNVTATDLDNDAMTYEWSFGDGSSSSSENPTHVYRAGDFTPEVSVSDATSTTKASTKVKARIGGCSR
jgi:PKD repeat protein